MSPGLREVAPVIPRFPRVSGDEPASDAYFDWVATFSPRERG